MTDTGRAVSLIASVGSGEAIDIRPEGSEEYVVHNIYHSAAVGLYMVRGAVELKLDDQAGSDAWAAYVFHVTNVQFLRLKDWSGAQQYLGYDGVCTHGS